MPFAIDANATQSYYGEEAGLGAQSAGPWYPLEPNSYADWGVTTKTVQRSPLNIARQQAKGTQTELDVMASFQTDFTQNNCARLLQGFYYADVADKPTTAPTNGVGTAVSAATAGGFTLAAAVPGLLVNHIVHSEAFGTSTNNGVMLLSAVAGGTLTATNIYGGAPVAEGAPPAAAKITAVGYRLSASAAMSGLLVVPATLTDTGGVDFTALGLHPGEWIYIGDAGNVTASANFNLTGGTSGTILRGYARISAIAPTRLTFDFVTFGGNGDAAAATTAGVDIWFGSYLQNQRTLATIKHRSYTLPRYLGQGVGNASQLEVLYGCVPDKFTLNCAMASKLTADLTFVGINSGYQNIGMLPGTIQPFFNEAAYNTSRDIFASLLTLVGTESTTLFAYATDAKVMIDNGATTAKALGSPSGFDVNLGDFKATGTLAVYFDDVRAIQAVQANVDTGYTTIFSKNNAGFVFDIPLLTLGGGKLKVEKDKKIMVDMTADGAANVNQYVSSYTRFSYLPGPAMSGYTGI